MFSKYLLLCTYGIVLYCNAAGYRCRRWVDGQLFREVVVMKEIMISSLDKLECVDNSCYLGDLFGAGGGPEEASRARARGAWAKFRELAPVLISSLFLSK